MNNIKISSAESIVGKNQYKNELISWEALKGRFIEPKRTAGTMYDYHFSYDKAEQSKEKNANGGYVGGWLSVNKEADNLHRDNNNILLRTLLTYDFDNCKQGYDDKIIDELNASGYAYILYTTHSHTPNKPRFRVLIPLDREVSPLEYEAVARRFISTKLNGIPATLDSTTFEPARVMFYPTAPKDSPHYINEWADGEALSADAVLSTYKTQDYANEWDLHPSEQAKQTTTSRPTGDISNPKNKPSYIGAFNRAYNIHEAIETFISDKYIPSNKPNRYTWAEGSMADGAIVYSDFSEADHLHSSHDTDPANGQNNAFDLVRKHLYGHLDKGLKVANLNELPSQQSMIDLCKEDKKVMAEYGQKQHKEFDFSINDNVLKTDAPAPTTQKKEKSEKELAREEIAKIDFDKATVNDISKSLHDYLTRDEVTKLFANTSPLNQLEHFKKQLDIDAGKPTISTGFKGLDGLLDGGLYAGLYFIGAISSLGKTTFLLQVADQIAQQGQDVLMFSLEMSRFEVMAKSLSRITHELSLEDDDEYYYMTDGKPKKIYNARTLRQITDKRRYKGYTDTNGKHKRGYTPYQLELIERAYKRYEEYAGNLFIQAGIGSIDIETIKEAVEVHTKLRGQAPVVIIDYLQIIAPDGTFKDIRGSVDINVTELKAMSVKHDTPVIAISSLNRENYKSGISMTAFKESGGIEYSSDVLIGLQFSAQREVDLKNANKMPKDPVIVVNHDEEKTKEPRQIELKVLKQRNGQATGSMDYIYNAKFNHFRETGYLGNDKPKYDLSFLDKAPEKKDEPIDRLKPLKKIY